jgi:hypothetical protein
VKRKESGCRHPFVLLSVRKRASSYEFKWYLILITEEIVIENVNKFGSTKYTHIEGRGGQ